MGVDKAALDSLRRAVEKAADDVPLRVHLADMLIRAGLRDEGIRHLGAVLQRDPANAAALAMLQDPGQAASTRPEQDEQQRHESERAEPVREGPELADPRPGARAAGEPADGSGYDWRSAEREMGDLLPPMFTHGPTPANSPGADTGNADSPASERAFDVEPAGLTLADVAGLTEVKQRLEAAFLAPMRHPELSRLYGKSLRGGLLLYGPPGCGKTFIARAVAGELQARFMAVSFADVIDMYVGQSERNIHELFAAARRNAPCVLFLDEVDAIGQKRSQLRHTPLRSAVNQLLLELDDVTESNTGLFLLAATNHPWDVDSALRRPGRFDRTVLVLPPDAEAREAVFRYHLKSRPVAGIDLARLASLTDGFSGADIAHICETAVERALLDSVRRGEPRLIGQPDLEAAAAEVKPSLGPWFEIARNVAMYANEGGAYDDLAAYLKKRPAPVTEQADELAAVRALVELRRHEEAASRLAHVIAADPSNATPWCLLSAARFGMADYSGALDAANRAAELAPDHDWPHRLASVALVRVGNAAEGLRAASTACSLAPNSWHAHACRAQAATAAGLYKDMIAVANEAAATARSLAPDEPSVYITSGQVSFARGDLKEARAYHEQALALDPENSQALNELGRIAVKRWDARAAGYFASALRIQPSGVYGTNIEILVTNTVSRTLALCGALCLGSLFLIGVERLTPAGAAAALAIVVALCVLLGAVQLRRLQVGARVLLRDRRLQAAIIAVYGAPIASAVIVATASRSKLESALGVPILLVFASRVVSLVLIRRIRLKRRRLARPPRRAPAELPR